MMTSTQNPFGAGLELLEHLGHLEDHGPVAIVVEDLHWADLASRQALLTVAKRLDQDRVILIVSSRPETATDGWDRFRLGSQRCTSLLTRPFSVHDVAALAEAMDVPLDPGGPERLHRHTNGHPLYVRTLLLELDREQLVGVGDLPVPRSLASTIVAALMELPELARELASALSVLNQRVPLAVAGRVAESGDAAGALEHLLPTGFVEWWPREHGTPVELAHPLIRTAIYDDLSPTARRRLHRAAAALVDDAQTALEHRVAAADGPDDDLAELLVEAAGSARRRGALSSAATQLLRVSGLCSDVEDRRRCTLRGIELLVLDQQVNTATTFLPRVEALPDGARRSLVLGLLAWSKGDAETAERHLLAACVASGGSGEDEVRASALIQLASLYFNAGDGDRAVKAATEALALGPLDRDQEQQAWSNLALGEGMRQGAPAGIERLSERIPEPADHVGPTDAILLTTRGALGFYAGRTTAAIADLRAAAQMGREATPVPALPRVHIHLAQLLFAQGDWDEAMVQARVGLSLVENEAFLWVEAQAHAALGAIHAARGEWDLAAHHAASAQRAAKALGTTEAVFTACYLDASIARARSDPGTVVAAIEPLARHPESIPMLSSLGWWSVLVEAFIDLGDLKSGQWHLAALANGTEARHLDFRARLASHRARLAAARKDANEAKRHFEQAIELFDSDDPLLDRALTQRAFGLFLAGSGDRRGAVAQLRSAHGLLLRVTADPFLRGIETDLATLGTGPGRQHSREGRSSLRLTDRQRDVAVLVARGYTNREVAGQLYLSEKAVEYHLGHIFAKLGLRSRRELRDHRALVPLAEGRRQD